MKNLSDELGWRPSEEEVSEALRFACKFRPKGIVFAEDAGFTLSDGRWVQITYFAGRVS